MYTIKHVHIENETKQVSMNDMKVDQIGRITNGSIYVDSYVYCFSKSPQIILNLSKLGIFWLGHVAADVTVNLLKPEDKITVEFSGKEVE